MISPSTGRVLKDATDRVTFIGYDDWNRALFKGNKSGVVVVDVDGELHSISDPDNWAEPCTPLGYTTPKVDESHGIS
jgi:hypothetical protein